MTPEYCVEGRGALVNSWNRAYLHFMLVVKWIFTSNLSLVTTNWLKWVRRIYMFSRGCKNLVF